MSRFTVFDVETPNYSNNRMSAIGITVLEDGCVKDTFFSFVNPETHFDTFNTELTGIDENTVKNAPTFPELWEEIKPLMSGGILVAHNAVFDLGVLKRCLCDYGIVWQPYVRYVCTVTMGRRLLPGMRHNLNVLCDYFGIELDHHKADSDSNACATLLRRYIESGADVNEFIRTYSFNR